MKRIWKTSLITLALIVAAAWAALRIYLHSSGVAAQVASQIEALYGGPVSIEKVDIGFTSTTLSGLKLFEPGSETNSASPWLTAQSVTVDVPLWRLAEGDIAPTRVVVKGATVLLRFNDAGDLVTRLPNPLQQSNQAIPWERVPELEIEHAKVILRKGRAGDLTADNIDMRVVKQTNRLVLHGSADSEAGKLALDGYVEESSSLATLSVKTETTARVTQHLIDRVPLVPAAILQELRVESADAAGALTVTYDLPRKALHFSADLDARDASIYLPSIAVAVHQGSAKVTIDDNLVRLRQAQGQALGGVVHARGDLAFHGPVTRLSFAELKAENLHVNDVPESWGIPALVRKSVASGKLFGVAKVDLTIGDPGAIAAAAATVMGGAASVGAVGNASLVAAFPLDQIRLESQGKGEVRDPAGKHEPMEFDWQLAQPVRHGDNARMRRPAENPLSLLATLIMLDADLPAQDAPAQSTKPPNYFDLKFNLKNASLAELIKNEDLKLPVPIDGKISLQVKAAIPLDRLHDLKAYKAEGAAQIKQLTAAGVKLDELTTDFSLGEGVLHLKSLHSAFADNAGKPGAMTGLSGSGQIQLAPLGDMRADLKFDRIPLHKLADQPPDEIQGTISGTLAIRGNADKLDNAKGLEADGKFAARSLTIYGVTADDFATSVQLKDGVLSFPDLQARIDGDLIRPTASLRLNDDHSLLAKIGVDISALRRIAAAKKLSLPPVTGTLSADAIVKSKPDPARYAISGDIETKNLKVDGDAVEDLRVHWELDGNKLALNAALYEGKVTGSALLPKDDKSTGRLDLQVQELNVGRVAKALRMPVALEGRVAGTLQGTFTPGVKDQEGKAEVHIDFKSPKLRVQNIPAEQLQGTLAYQRGKIDYNLTGKSLGGTFDLQGQIPGAAEAPKQKAEKGQEGRLRIKDVRVGRLLDALGASAAADMRGTLNIDVPFTHDTPDRFPKGKGTVRITKLQMRDSLVAENIEGEVVLADQQLSVRNLQGDLAQGTLDGHLDYYFREPERSNFKLNLDSVASQVLLAPWLQDKIEGTMQARLRGKLGRVWRGSAELELARGKVAGLEFTDWRLPVAWSFAPGEGRAEAEIRETSLQLARGRAVAKLAVSWENSARVEGFVRLDRVELGDLLKHAIGKSGLGAGRTTAKLELKGSDVRSLKDVSGVLVASFEDHQTLQVPVLQQVAPYLGVNRSTTFQKGSLLARIDRGTAKIEQLTLQGNNVQVYIDGTVTMEEQLNLHVVAKNGDVGWPTIRLGPIGLRVPVAGPVPLVMAQEVSTLISNHVAYLDVTGTPASPVIRPRPLPILSAEAVRFFLNPPNSPITLNP